MLISGNELAMLFAEVLGDPSPAGKTPIDLDALKQVANDNVGYPMAHGRKTRSMRICTARPIRQALLFRH